MTKRAWGWTLSPYAVDTFDGLAVNHFQRLWIDILDDILGYILARESSKVSNQMIPRNAIEVGNLNFWYTEYEYKQEESDWSH